MNTTIKISSCLLFISFLALSGLVHNLNGQNPYITIWQTDNEGESNDNEIIIPASGTFDYTWEEVGNPGNTGTGSGVDKTMITFPTAGTYSVSITPITFHSIEFRNEGDTSKIIDISQWGDTQWSSFNQAYQGCVNLEITATDIPNLSSVTSMNLAFSYTSISTVPNMNNWDVSNVTNMAMMFYDATKFNSEIGNWDVSNVTTMQGMFEVAIAFNQDIGGWDVSNVTNMETTFSFAQKFNQDIGNWDVGKVADMFEMFQSTFDFNHDIGGWDVSNVKRMSGMFSMARSFNQDIGSWDVSNVEDMAFMFQNAEEFNQDIGSWNLGKVLSTSGMFHRAEKFNQNIGNWDMSNVIQMSGMFHTATAFNQDIGGWDVGNAINMYQMFYMATSFNHNLNSWNVSKVNSMFQMFYGATSYNQPMDSWNVGNVENMAGMYEGAVAFNQAINSWDISKLTLAAGMFKDTETFNQPLDNWNTSNILDMSVMFNNATAFNQSLNNWDVSKVEFMGGILNDAAIYNHSLENWELSNILQGASNGPGFSNTAMSCENYGATLKGWATNPNTRKDLFLEANTILYEGSPEVIAAREYLEADLNWTIQDAGECSNFICLFSDEKKIICPGDSVEFIDLSTGEIESWEWIFPGGAPSVSTDQNPRIHYNNAGTFDVSLTITSLTGEISSYEIKGLITVVEFSPSVTVLQDESCLEACDGAAIASGGGSYEWSNGKNTAEIKNLCAGVYVVTISNSAGCTLIDSITIDSGSSMNTDAFVMENASCALACDGVAQATGGVSYLWSNGTSAARAASLCIGEHQVTITDTNGCSAIHTITIEDGNHFSAEAFIEMNESCAGACDGAAYATGGDTYEWSNGTTGAVIDGLCPGVYYVTISSEEGCFTTDSVQISKGIEMNGSVELLNNINCGSTCDGSAIASGGFSYEWSNGETTAEATMLCEGMHYVTITGDKNCFAIDSVFVQGAAEFEVSLFSNYISAGAGDSVLVYFDYFSSTPVNIDWKLEDNFICVGSGQSCDSILVFPTHSQTIRAIVTDINGCQASESVEIEVENNKSVYIPNAFSPNDDGVNDTWEIGFGPQVESLRSLEVFDRYGNRIHQLKNVEIQRHSLHVWDGSFKNNLFNSGVFIYKLEVVYKDGKTKMFKGHINLLR